MISLRIVRKIGKMLRGGAGKKEIFLGALCGILIGMLPGANLMLAVLILAALLLNANLGFTLLGVAVGKILCLILAIPTFHIGYFIIHSMGLEGLFTSMANTPVLALMGLDNYSQVGGAPIAIIVAIVFAKMLSTYVNKIREQMLRASQHEKIGKATGNKFSKFLLWLAFGKQKISTADVLEKQSPLFRKSGLILVGVFLVIGLLMELLFLDLVMKKTIADSISKSTGAEVNMDKAHLSIFGGTLDIQNLQVANADKPTHNLVQIGQLTSDISVSALLRKALAIDLLAGSVVQSDTLRDQPGKVFETSAEKQAKKEQKAKEKAEAKEGKSLDDYLAQAEKYQGWLGKAADYLEKQRKVKEFVEGGPEPKPTKDELIELARKIGYLNMTADLLTDRPAWLIHKIQLDKITLSKGAPLQKLDATEVCSSPAINGQPTTIILTPQGAIEPTAKITLRFDDPAALHEIFANMKDVDISGAVDTDEIKVESGKADISADGTFTADNLDLPFTLMIRELKTNNDALNKLKKLELPGKLYGSLASPRVKVELDDKLKDAVVDAAKEQAKAKAKKAAEKELNKALESDEAQEAKSKAQDALKKLF